MSAKPIRLPLVTNYIVSTGCKDMYHRFSCQHRTFRYQSVIIGFHKFFKIPPTTLDVSDDWLIKACSILIHYHIKVINKGYDIIPTYSLSTEHLL